MPEKLSRTPLVVVQSEGVTVSDFELHGNGDTVPQAERAPLLVLEAGGFTVERGLFTNSSKDGILIDGSALTGADLTGGVVRDIVGRVIRRDLVSVGGSGATGHRIRNVLFDNVRCYGSEFRGTVEVSDGSENITVRKVYAEDCLYAIDVQDHGNPNQINRNVVIEDVYARNSRHAIRTASKPLGHTNLVLRNIVAEHCVAPLEIKNIDNVTLHGVTILDHTSPNPPVSVVNCDGLSIRDVTIKDVDSPARRTPHPGLHCGARRQRHSARQDWQHVYRSSAIGSPRTRRFPACASPTSLLPGPSWGSFFSNGTGRKAHSLTT